jgi:uncharacterized caspase-like protein
MKGSRVKFIAVSLFVLLLLLSYFLIIGRQSRGGPQRRVYVPEERSDVSLSPFYRTSWALLIGVNTYPNLPIQYQLRYAVRDVDELRKVLIQRYGFPPSNITVLTEGEATGERIRKAMGQLADTSRVNVNDQVLIYFSGHGQTVHLPNGGKMGFILPYDAKVNMNEINNPSPYYTTCIGMDELRRLSTLIPAKHILFLIDACYSGLAISSQRGLRPEMPNYLETVMKLRVRQVITAGLEGEQTVENSEWGHGAFTYKLLEALKTGVADSNGDGVITALELAGHLRNAVPSIAHQTPQFGYFEGEGEFLLFYKVKRPTPQISASQHYEKAKRLLSQLQFEEAISEFREAIRLKPNSIDSYIGMGVCLYSLGRLDEAIEAYRKALHLGGPSAYVAHYNLGLALKEKGLYRDAIRQFELYLTYDKNSMYAYKARKEIAQIRQILTPEQPPSGAVGH